MESKARLPRLLAVLSLALAVLMAGCGGGKAEPTPTATTSPPTATSTPEPLAIEDLAQRVVRIVALADKSDPESELWSGSGTIVDQEGFILTNYHVISKELGEANYEALAILLTSDPSEPPKLKYYAEVYAYDPELDLAVVGITETASGRKIRPGELDLASVELEESPKFGSDLTVLGYPGVGEETITFTAGKLSGTITDKSIDLEGGWYKTDAEIAPGNSGGGAFGPNGKLIGVPTRFEGDLRETGQATFQFREGRIRPIKFALDLIDEALASASPLELPEFQATTTSSVLAPFLVDASEGDFLDQADTPMPNEARAAFYKEPDSVTAKLEEAGRLTGLTRTFNSDEPLRLILQRVDLWETPEDAEGALGGGCAEIQSALEEESSGFVDEPNVVEGSVPAGANATCALEYLAPATEDQPNPLEVRALGLIMGPATVLVAIVGPEGEVDYDEAAPFINEIGANIQHELQ